MPNSSSVPQPESRFAGEAGDELIATAHTLRQLADDMEAHARRARSDQDQDPSWVGVLELGRPAGAPSYKRGTAGDMITAAVMAAIAGDSREARRRAAMAEFLDGADDSIAIGARLARSIAWMSEGRCTDAFETLVSLFDLAGVQHSADSLAAVTGVFAEVAARAHQADRARAALGSCAGHLDKSVGRARAEFLLANVLLGDPTGMSAAIDNPGRWSPLALARIRLVLGMRMRRSGHPRQSRPHLVMASDQFAHRGASPWLALARGELRAAGVRDTQTSATPVLSAQEQAVASLAASGLSNRDIGERLYLSPRTVGSHLYRIFPKLGVTSRHQLSEFLGG